MKLYAPQYYKDFRCIADRCRHSCCIGWEIDVDEDSLAFYEGLEGEYAPAIRASIDTADTPHFAEDGFQPPFCFRVRLRYGHCDILRLFFLFSAKQEKRYAYKQYDAKSQNMLVFQKIPPCGFLHLTRLPLWHNAEIL